VVRKGTVRKPADVYSLVQSIAVMMCSSEKVLKNANPLQIVSYKHLSFRIYFLIYLKKKDTLLD